MALDLSQHLRPHVLHAPLLRGARVGHARRVQNSSRAVEKAVEKAGGQVKGQEATVAAAAAAAATERSPVAAAFMHLQGEGGAALGRLDSPLVQQQGGQAAQQAGAPVAGVAHHKICGHMKRGYSVGEEEESSFGVARCGPHQQREACSKQPAASLTPWQHLHLPASWCGRPTGCASPSGRCWRREPPTRLICQPAVPLAASRPAVTTCRISASSASAARQGGE